ncbi:DUF4294 domain-containing protein [Flavobacterium sp. UMI-01]|uniref:DUF4294 domain-containing protein n=1 Tax=Flavobacterium sp. UMI-01 TaxID=1441053 RepID=UPI001C7D2CFB|nr:DUF4294 domain-containing protein [Flavobacterium sp. UMI-01]GIZ08628.1 hypothetical protein FUMI01_13550 [Flavobacterium sp. UMI-01]
MKFFITLIGCFLLSSNGVAQIIPSNPKIRVSEIDESYDIEKDTIQLEEIIISKQKLNEIDRKQFLILQNRVLVTYPYAKLAADRLVSLNKGMDRLSNAREKKKYFKIVEDYLTNEFEARLKKLSRSQGRILVKLIHRQTGATTYELVKELKSGWKAFWSNTAASMFDIDLKSKYQPYDVNEDFLIETILFRAFNSGRLQYQPPAKAVDIDDLSEHWLAKAQKEK